jgi:arylformamidase
MSGFDRRAFMTTAAAAMAAPCLAEAKDATAMNWATMPLAARDAAFNNQLATGAELAKSLTDGYVAASLKFRERHPQHLGLSYGSGARNKWDLYPGQDPKAPCFVFIFGGWWQRNSRESFACVAEGVLAHGWSAAFPDYTLAPDASLTQITKEIRMALDWLSTEGSAQGISGPIVLSGWSAGGHLAAFAADHPLVAAALPISGAFELGPLRDVPSVNAKLKLTDIEVETLSPLRLPVVNKPITIAYGSAELPGMVANSRDLHARRANSNAPGVLLPIPHANHFSILQELQNPQGMLTRAALHLAEDIKSFG